MEKMLLANGSDFANVVDKANVSLCCSIAFTDTNVPKPIQEISPGVRPYPVPHSHSDFMIGVTVTLEKRRDETPRCNIIDTALPLSSSVSTKLIINTSTSNTSEFYHWCVAEVAHNFSYVLNDSHIVLSTVIPELGSREFTS